MDQPAPAATSPPESGRTSVLPEPFAGWFARRGWAPHPHQLALLERAGDPATLLIAPTGGGKTLAGFLPSLVELGAAPPPGLHTLYVSPLKALAADIRRNLASAGRRDGPRAAHRGPHRRHRRRPQRARQRVDPPHILLTTPESLALMLSYPEAPAIFGGLARVILDEIHALAESKRGDQLALCLARLQTLAPGMRRVGLSATVEDPPALARFLGGGARVLAADPGPEPDLTILETEAPPPWAGQGGRYAAGAVMDLIRAHRTTLVFINTRAQAELFFQALWAVNDADLPIGLHHGSLSREARQRVEAAMATGALRAIVATGSLDLGIDWGDVDLVIQVGAPEERQAPGPAHRPRQPPLQRALTRDPRAGQPLRGARMPRRARRGRRARPRRRAARPGPARRALPAHPADRLRRPVRRGRAVRRGAHGRALRRPQPRRLRRLPRLLRHRRLRAARLRPLAPAGRARRPLDPARPAPRPRHPHERRHHPRDRDAQGPRSAAARRSARSRRSSPPASSPATPS